MGSRLPPSPPGTWWTKSSGGNFFIGCPVLYLVPGTLWTRYLVPVIKFENVWTEAQDIFKGCQNHKRCWVLVSACNYANPPKGPQGKGASKALFCSEHIFLKLHSDLETDSLDFEIWQNRSCN